MKTSIVYPMTRGQITIPKKIRDELKIRPDTPLAIDHVGDQIHITPLRSFDTQSKEGTLLPHTLSGEEFVKHMQSFSKKAWTKNDSNSIRKLKKKDAWKEKRMNSRLPQSVVIDTSCILDYLQSHDKSNHVLQNIFASWTCYLVIEQVAELYSGKRSDMSPQKDMIETIINRCDIYVPSIEFMRRVGKTRRLYQLSFIDACIAQFALEQNYPLATLDLKAFSTIKGLRILDKKQFIL